MATGLTLKCYFVLGLPSESLKIPKVGTITTLGAYNIVRRPMINVKFKEKL